ncbi:phosphatase [Shewanella glacialipiscicola]|uniref:Phosphatase n=1 Tax=Shewanella glacialipiscicola TaxID=614069 RepID=A0ABQ6J5C7_9GAMM|nr:phosphatase [Shewanella glacialipiscicola]MCL1084866.1 phosphatase [Shewanella glacialipiscicola]GIU11441.1 putative phosphatase [Shewanella glacialipiscicola]GMA82726.1 putative phosphatase [Shewanella glacialipiscicola]
MQYQVDTHTHTVASSHAYSTIHDYIAVAKQKGIRLFANTDHGPDMADAPHFWHFVNLRVLPRMVDGVGILRGIEANIKNIDGEIDFFGDYLKQLDIVLAGFHEPVYPPSDKATHTKAMINAIKSGNVDIITHPGNPAYPIDIEAVARAAAEYGVALEINNSSFEVSRKGSEANCTAIAQAAKEFGTILVMGSDSHVAFSLGGFTRAQAIIDEVAYPPSRLLNRSPSALLAFLAARGHETVSDLIALFNDDDDIGDGANN